MHHPSRPGRDPRTRACVCVEQLEDRRVLSKFPGVWGIANLSVPAVTDTFQVWNFQNVQDLEIFQGQDNHVGKDVALLSKSLTEAIANQYAGDPSTAGGQQDLSLLDLSVTGLQVSPTIQAVSPVFNNGSSATGSGISNPSSPTALANAMQVTGNTSFSVGSQTVSATTQAVVGGSISLSEAAAGSASTGSHAPPVASPPASVPQTAPLGLGIRPEMLQSRGVSALSDPSAEARLGSLAGITGSGESMALPGGMSIPYGVRAGSHSAAEEAMIIDLGSAPNVSFASSEDSVWMADASPDDAAHEPALEFAGAVSGRPTVDLSALERGMSRFLEKMDHWGSELAQASQSLSLPIWLSAATLAAVAGEAARRHVQRAGSLALGGSEGNPTLSWSWRFSGPPSDLG
jgi:hypothetical protein